LADHPIARVQCKRAPSARTKTELCEYGNLVLNGGSGATSRLSTQPERNAIQTARTSGGALVHRIGRLLSNRHGH
jgi:hypothetical protein